MVKILLVEDDKSLREIYGVRLLAEGYDIVSAGDGEEALAMAIKEKPQLIISDVMMPKISGFDMLDILRSTTETRDIKVIMMTALSSDDQRARGEQLGADKYLVKSQVGIEDVVRTVHEVLGDKDGAAPASAGTPAAPAPAPAAPQPAPAPASTPAADAPAPADAAKPADDAASPSVAETSVTPGNEDAGPLPVQPSEITPPAPVEPPVPVETPVPVESSLPQPTAPFSSPAPANLGETALHPDESPGDVTAPIVPDPLNVPTANEGAARPGEKIIQPLNMTSTDSAPASLTIAPDVPAGPSITDPTLPQPGTADDSDQSPSVSGPSTPVA